MRQFLMSCRNLFASARRGAFRRQGRPMFQIVCNRPLRIATRWQALALVAYLAFASGACPAAAPADAAGFLADCGNPFENAYGPFDYRTATASQKKIVESVHFTAEVEQLRAGITGSIGTEIDYTLRAFPNHPRALMAMIRLGQRDKTVKPRGAQYTVECYLNRAVRFRPNDMNARQLRGIYGALNGKPRQAIDDFNAVLVLEPNNANAHYNLGLAYFDLKDYERAAQEARRAKELGFALEGLSHKLKSVGKPIE
jgi:tetratricopeptide (TPR) repeat protein